MNFIDKRISVKHAISILTKNGIRVDEKEACIILDFLYLMAKTYSKKDGYQNDHNLNEKSNQGKALIEHLFAQISDQNR